MSATRSFRLSPSDINRRHQTVAGEVVVALLIGYGAHHLPGGGELAAGLALLGKIFVAFFVAHVVSAHVRYVLTSRVHHLEVTPELLTFQTRKKASELPLAEVGHTERHARFREGPSLMLRLKNKRHVRLAGYEDQDELMELVEGHVARLQEG